MTAQEDWEAFHDALADLGHAICDALLEYARDGKRAVDATTALVRAVKEGRDDG